MPSTVLKPLASRSAQKFQKFSEASASPSIVFCASNGGAPNIGRDSFLMSKPDFLASACNISQLLSIAPPATANFLSLRSPSVAMVEWPGTITAPMAEE